MFDGDGDGLLGEVDTLRLLRFARPSLTDKQLDKCLIQVSACGAYTSQYHLNRNLAAHWVR
jgi:hypothetical protein